MVVIIDIQRINNENCVISTMIKRKKKKKYQIIQNKKLTIIKPKSSYKSVLNLTFTASGPNHWKWQIHTLVS